LHYLDATDLLKQEACTYMALYNLQGHAVPKLYSFYEVWGILQLLALEPIGNPILEDEPINQALHEKIKAVLQ